MNHDDKNLGKNPANDLELEARVVAAVLGEASAFELAELERLLAEKPELAVFKRRIEAVHGLVGDATRSEKEPERLSDERRAKLLSALGSPSSGQTVTLSGRSSTAAAYPAAKRQNPWMRMLPIAAGLMIGLFFSVAIKYSRSGYRDAEVAVNERRRSGPELLRESPPSESSSVSDAGTIDLADRPAAFVLEREGRPVLPKTLNGFVDTPAVPAGPLAAGTVSATSAEERKATGGARGDYNLTPGSNEQDSAGGLAKPLTYGEPRPALANGSAARSFRARTPEPVFGPLDGKRVLQQREKDVKADGYNASNTLSGTRVSSDLKDVGSAITATTHQSLEVTGRFEQAGDASKTWGAGGKAEPSQLFGFAASKKEAAVDNSLAPLAHPANKNPFTGKEPQLAQADSEAIVLSPFEVSTDLKTKGHLSNNGRDKKAVVKPTPSPRQEADQPLPRPILAPAKPAATQTESNAGQQPVSTFSLHVSDVSFRLAQAALARGEMPFPETIRPEEFYNAFNYGDPAPAMAEKVSCRIEQAAHPFLQQRNLVRIAVKVPATGHGVGQALRLTVLLDTSGSMEREDRAAAVRRALDALVSLLGPKDRLTLIGFARQPRLLAEDLPGDRAREALALLSRTPAEGGTNLEEALKLARELAVRHQQANAQNRIVLLTDGAANLGDADPAKLAASIEALRQQGIAFDACGVGTEGIDDTMLEALTHKGDGRYYVVNSPEDADSGFARQLAGAFRPAAQNVKLQVRFNPARVGAYRLIGFEQHRLNEEDFRNDKVDAAELAADEAAIAVYQVETLPQGEGEVGEVYVRFRDTATNNMVERSWTLGYDAHPVSFDRASPTLQLAGVSALLAEKLKDPALARGMKWDDLVPVVNRLRGHYAHEARVQELVQMFEQLRRMEAK